MAGPPPAAVTGKRYDAFISYSHAADDRFAPELQRGLQRFAKSWRQRRALEVFRDRTGLSANPDLWKGIEAALDSSEWFIHLASPDAAGSVWVGREIARWKETKDPTHLLVVLTDGTWAWDETRGRFDGPGSTAIHSELWDAFPAEPLVLDMRWAHGADRLTLRDPRFRDAVAELAAPIHGRAKDDLEDEDTRALRRTRRLAGSGVALLAVLLVAALVAGWVALGQRNEARSQRAEAQRQRNAARHQLRVSQARLLGTTATSLLGTDLGDAQLLAAQAWAMQPDPDTRAALFQAVAASPSLVRYVDAGDDVTALASSRDGRTVAIGTAGGRVLTWQPDGEAGPTALLTLSGPVSEVAVGDDGTVVASDGGQVRVSSHPDLIPAGQGLTVTAVGIAPDGGTVAVGEADDSGTGRLLTEDAGTLVPVSGAIQLGTPYEIGFWPAGGFTTLDGFGGWVVVSRGPGGRWRASDQGSVIVSAHNKAGTLSPDGLLIGITNGATTIPFYWVGNAGDTADLVAAAPGRAPDSLAVDPDDTHTAIADGGSIHVSRLVAPRASGEILATLTGNASITPGTLAFRGSATSLVSATGRYVAQWETSRTGRVARSQGAVVPTGCGTCTGPAVRVGPDGQTVAVVSNGGDGWALNRVGSDQPVLDRSGSGDFPAVVLPVWTRDGTRALVPGGGQVEVLDAATGATVEKWSMGDLDGAVAAGLTADGERLVLAGSDGLVETLDTSDGRISTSTRVDVPTGDTFSRVLVDVADGTVAVVTTDGVLLSPPTGGPTKTLPLTGLQTPDLAGGRLAAVSSEGAPTVWDTGSGAELWTAGPIGGVLAGPVLSPDGGRVAYQRSDGTG